MKKVLFIIALGLSILLLLNLSTYKSNAASKNNSIKVIKSSQFKTAILYKNGNKTVLLPDEYLKVSGLVNNKLNDINGELRLSITEEQIDMLKNNAAILELTANQKQTLNYIDKLPKKFTVNYDKLYIILSSTTKFNNNIIIAYDNNFPYVLLYDGNSSDLLNELSNLKK